jgi:hypothetical protein
VSQASEKTPKVEPATGEVVSDTGQLRPFSSWLFEQRGGSLHGELTDRLAEVVAAVVEHEKQGTLTLKITVKPGEDADYILVFDDVVAKAPEPAKSAALFYADKQGNLTRNNPRQPQLPLREVSGKEAPSA